ncbi:D-aminoacyl-tRNA deacylase [hydrothermal vent metagenome]|uniref:D-aminoacyl-tRNA deacylase n=1 Tax=hydrothermal vent metagenome TaxID=652676 RepID=A0A3B0TBC4_9ZZZZ
MKLVIQRVKSAQVDVASKTVGQIDQGMLVFLGVSKNDASADAEYLVNKIVNLRIFEDENEKMNLSALDCNAAFLVVSQFTLQGNCDKGRRPSFDKAADPKKAKDLYEYFVAKLKEQNVEVATGQFQAMMDVSLVNDGPVTFILESNRCTTIRKT